VKQVVVLLLLALAVPAVAGMEDVFPFEYRLVELDNGLKAYLIHGGGPGELGYITMVRTGSREEVEEGKSGFAHFFEHMMFRGTRKYPDYSGETASIGATRNAFTGMDRTCYFINSASEHLEKVIDLESDRFMNLEYTETAFRTEAGAVLGEYMQGATIPRYRLEEKVYETAFDQHTYKHTTMGFEADIRAMPEGYDYSRDFFRRFYRPENCVVVATGDFDFDEGERLIREYYTKWEGGYEAPDIKPEPEQTAGREGEMTFEGKTLPIISYNYKGPAWSATDRLSVAAFVLGRMAFGSSSDTYRKLVLREQLVQSLYADFTPLRDPGLLAINTTVIDPRDIERVRADIESTVEYFKNELVDVEKLDDTKSNMRYSFLNRLETALGISFSLMNPVIFTGRIEAIADYYETLHSITPEDVREAARLYLSENRRTVVTLTEEEGS